MTVNEKEWNEMNKKITDLEHRVKSQQKMFIDHMNEHEKSVEELKEIISTINNYRPVQQTS